MSGMEVWPNDSSDFELANKEQGRKIKSRLFGIAGIIPWKKSVEKRPIEIYSVVREVLGDLSGLNLMSYLEENGIPLDKGTLRFELSSLLPEPKYRIYFSKD